MWVLFLSNSSTEVARNWANARSRRHHLLTNASCITVEEAMRLTRTLHPETVVIDFASFPARDTFGMEVVQALQAGGYGGFVIAHRPAPGLIDHRKFQIDAISRDMKQLIGHLNSLESKAKLVCGEGTVQAA